jgi:hypothetical protein
MTNDSQADLTERLFADFEDQHDLSTIADTIRECRRQLDTPSARDLPELLERLARQRLTDLRSGLPER